MILIIEMKIAFVPLTEILRAMFHFIKFLCMKKLNFMIQLIPECFQHIMKNTRKY